jgi:signal transduction histidine kinase
MWVVGLGIVACDITEILLVATLSGFTETASLEESVWPIARLALVSLLVPMVSATGGAALLNLALGVPFGEGWGNWYLATASGLVIVTPLLLCWTDRRLRTSDWRRVIPETLLLAGLVAIVGYLDFHDAVPGLFLVFPFLLLTTFQGRLLGATTAAAAVATVAIWSTFTGHGPIATFAGTNFIAKIHYLQLYIAVVLLSVLPLAALLGHREKLAAQLRAFTETLEERVKERTRQLQAENEARRQTEAALAHANRLATMGQLTASIAHEVSQPVAATVTNAQAALRWLNGQAPVLEEARQALADIVNDGDRASQVIDRVRAHVKKAPPRRDDLEINRAIREVVELTRGEAVKNGVSVRTELADSLPLIYGDRVQLQQVVLNLIINAIEAMSGVSEGARDLLITTGKAESGGVLVAVRDSGPGIAPESADRLFDSFYTTKRDGLGMGLSICHSIIEVHQGQLWATANTPRGAIFQFTLPTRQSRTESNQ